MRWTAALLEQPRRFLVVFVAAELLLAMAIPFVAIEGYHTLLESRAGRFVEEPTRSEPGWRALVAPTAVVGVAEVDQGAVTGVALLTQHPELRSAGTVVLAPGSLEIEGVPIGERPPPEAVEAVGRFTRLAIDRVEVLDDHTWGLLLGDATYSVESPDPVMASDGGALFEVGAVDVGAAIAAPFLGRPAPGAAPISVTTRRHALWNALISEPPETEHPLAQDLRAMDPATAQVVDLPMTELQPVARPDPAAIEALIRDVVAYPVGAVPGDRLQVRILDRTGTADLEDIAAAVASRGMEVMEIGNAGAFDEGPTEVVVPAGVAGQPRPGIDPAPDPAASPPPATPEAGIGVPANADDLAELLIALDLAGPTVDPTADPEDRVVTLLVGRDFDLSNLY